MLHACHVCCSQQTHYRVYVFASCLLFTYLQKLGMSALCELTFDWLWYRMQSKWTTSSHKLPSLETVGRRLSHHSVYRSAHYDWCCGNGHACHAHAQLWHVHALKTSETTIYLWQSFCQVLRWYKSLAGMAGPQACIESV